MPGLLLKVTVLFTAGLLTLFAARRSTAAVRHLICLCALAGSLLLPAAAFLPSKIVPIRLPAIDVTGLTLSTTPGAHWPAASTLLAIWACGTTLFLIRLGIGYWRIHRLIRAATILEPSLVAADVNVPIVSGLFRPVVMMPRSSQNWPDWQRAAATRHELTHIARNDLWANCIASLACALYWFHPLAWTLASLLRDNQEKACDDAVLQSGFEPAAYASALLGVARSSNSTLLPGCSMTTQTNLKTRIARLLDGSIARTTSPLTRRGAVLVFAGLIAALAVMNPAAGQTGKVYKVEGDVQPPRVLAKIDPDYTEEARDNKIQGTVTLSMVIGADGRAHDITIIRPLDPGLDRNAAEIIQKWTFAPGTLHGEPVDVRATIEVNFKLQ
jgi:TonB family protein